MKKIYLILAFISSLLTGQYAFSQTAFVKPVVIHAKTIAPSFDMQVFSDSTNHEKFVVQVNNPQGENVRIRVDGLNGTGFSGSFTDILYRKRFDMSGVEDGRYTITVWAGNKTIKRSIVLSTKTEVVRNIALNN